MTDYCCGATGLSSHAIARAYGHCYGGGVDYPRDPSDLMRCITYMEQRSLTAKGLKSRMRQVSPEWAALVKFWDSLTALLDEEIAEGTGSAPRTYRRMRHLLDGARTTA